MYPILFEIFGYPISTFGIMMALGFLAATGITSVRLQEQGRDPEFATTAQMTFANRGYATVIANTDEDPEIQARIG